MAGSWSTDHDYFMAVVDSDSEIPLRDPPEEQDGVLKRQLLLLNVDECKLNVLKDMNKSNYEKLAPGGI